jgi:uncharacterized protein (TIGR03067 family)
MGWVLLTAVALSLVVAGCNPVDNLAVQRELERLQGTWIGLSYMDAQQTLDGRQMAMSLAITGNEFRVRFNDQVIAQGKLALDPTRFPKTMDFVEDKQIGTGIYELYENSLRVCYDGIGQERPSKFEVKPGSAIRLCVLQRQPRDAD